MTSNINCNAFVLIGPLVAQDLAKAALQAFSDVSRSAFRKWGVGNYFIRRPYSQPKLYSETHCGGNGVCAFILSGL